MDDLRFDRLTQRLSSSNSRRTTLVLLLGATALTTGNGRAAAGPGCKDVGRKCRRAQECCSDVCKGKKGKRRCKAHDTGGCRAGFFPEGNDRPTRSCTSSSGAPGSCATTTGNAGYCVGGGDCRVCSKDADCHALCGPRAACVLSPIGCAGLSGTVCVGPDGVVCPL